MTKQAASEEANDAVPVTGNKSDGRLETAQEGEGRNEENPSVSLVRDRPIVCILEDSHIPNEQQRSRMFRIVRSKGKALASGGFGVTISTNSSGEQTDAGDDVSDTDQPQEPSLKSDAPPNGPTTKDSATTDDPPPVASKKAATKSAEYLFVEEVLFLHEKGLLCALLPNKVNDTDSVHANHASGDVDVDDDDGIQNATPLDSSQLYQMLSPLGMSLAMYRVYSHLRSQDFRVLRHDPDRYEILCLQRDDAEERRQRKILARQQQLESQEQPTNEESSSSSALPKDDALGESAGTTTDTTPGDALPPRTSKNARKNSLTLRHRVRQSIQNAPPPSIPHPTEQTKATNNATIGICWDAYNPNSNFGKTHPGLPDFYVTATYYNVPMVTFSELKALLKDKCRGIPLKVATVSDSGTVVMFGVTDYGIPSLAQKSQTTD